MRSAWTCSQPCSHTDQEKQRDLSHLTENLENWDVVKKAPHKIWETLEGRQMIEKRLKMLVSRPVLVG